MGGGTTMEPRISFPKVAPGGLQAMLGLSNHLRNSGLEESPYYSDRERAALAWTEAVTNIRDGHVPDEVYERVQVPFAKKELANLTLAITVINSWNRINIALRTPAGDYQPAKSNAAVKS